MSETSYIICYITAPSEEEAREITKVLIQKRLVACANIIKDISSIFTYKGKLYDEREVAIIAKSRQDLFSKISETVKEHHSYETPCIIALPIIDGCEEFLKWIETETEDSNSI